MLPIDAKPGAKGRCFHWLKAHHNIATTTSLPTTAAGVISPATTTHVSDPSGPSTLSLPTRPMPGLTTAPTNVSVSTASPPGPTAGPTAQPSAAPTEQPGIYLCGLAEFDDIFGAIGEYAHVSKCCDTGHTVSCDEQKPCDGITEYQITDCTQWVDRVCAPLTKCDDDEGISHPGGGGCDTHLAARLHRFAACACSLKR